MAICHKLLSTKTCSLLSVRGISLKQFNIPDLLSDESGSFMLQKKHEGLVQVCSSRMLAILLLEVAVVMGFIFFVLRAYMALRSIEFRVLDVLSFRICIYI